uniref:WLM domain-containing protein n=1 Tax=Corethron hystrix TaxID=216773 RepID=A0A7S1BJE0_9STRA|mmetsp:Transcript_27914/g.63912  ORF Transcript_27914/g.63912 Transcript_27914/m.63912 type:complete len:283 (+) Transcript_27914:291-1139(+)
MSTVIAKDPAFTKYSEPTSRDRKKKIRLIATGQSQTEAAAADRILREGMASHRIRDDLSDAGRREEERRRRKGFSVLSHATRRNLAITATASGLTRRFGRIETLSGLPDERRAHSILESLANDPGILACMTKHGWSVGCLAEMYPDGRVGQDPVCVMGLNENKGQRILLRLRTDDLKGFRKILSIRKVLFHELAHNVHSNHGTKFFVLMRQVEKECNEMDWTQSSGQRVAAGGDHGPLLCRETSATSLKSGESGNILGGSKTPALSSRELATLAAMRRMKKP